MDIIPLKINETYKVMKLSLPSTQRTKNLPYYLEYDWNLEKSTLLKLEHMKLQKFIDLERRKEKVKEIVKQLDQLKEEEKCNEDKKICDENERNEHINSDASSSYKLSTESKAIANDALHKNSLPSDSCVKSNLLPQCSDDLRFNDANLSQTHKIARLKENQYSQLELASSDKIQRQKQLSSPPFNTDCETSNSMKKYPSDKNSTPNNNSKDKNNKSKIVGESIKFDAKLKDRLYSYKNEGNIAAVDFSEFDNVRSDPFENLQLDTINEVEELSNVLEQKMRHSVTRPKTLKISSNIK